ncbi:MAG: L,D-transpeptidase [Polyangiaceae bacterium]|nr:L,D-transpeptidase [Polyangiaceae bacterium]
MRTALGIWVLAALSAACSAKSDAAEDQAAPALASTTEATGTSASSSSEASATATERADAPLAAPGDAIVDLAGEYHAPPPPPADSPKVYARAMLVPIHDKPNQDAKKIGFLRAGAVVAITGEEAGKSGCSGGWRPVAPAGFVCIGDKATLEASDDIVRAVRPPDLSQKLPYMYGTVTRGGPAYARIPTKEDLDEFEPGLDKHIRKWKDDEVSGASYGQELWYKWSTPSSQSAWDAWEQKVTDTTIPWYLKDGHRVPNLSGLVKGDVVKIDQVDRRQGAAFIDSFLWEGRRYNVTTDLRVVPADRYRPIKGSDMHGVRIGVDVEFPFALIRKKGAKQWIWGASKKKMTEGEDIPYRSALQLTGKQKIYKDILHYETKDGYWVDDRHASRLDPAKRMPKWGKNGEKWLDVNITKQTLVAFEGEKAVFATLVSTGEDGLLEGARTTRKGIFRIHTKYVTQTMDSDAVGEEFELRDVPYVQYFEEGFALHGAYWHDSFGTPKSHGCINLAPEDARRLFHWTEPHVPAGWHGAAKSLTGTVLFVHP